MYDHFYTLGRSHGSYKRKWKTQGIIQWSQTLLFVQPLVWSISHISDASLWQIRASVGLVVDIASSASTFVCDVQDIHNVLHWPSFIYVFFFSPSRSSEVGSIPAEDWLPWDPVHGLENCPSQLHVLSHSCTSANQRLRPTSYWSPVRCRHHAGTCSPQGGHEKTSVRRVYCHFGAREWRRDVGSWWQSPLVAFAHKVTETSGTKTRKEKEISSYPGGVCTNTLSFLLKYDT